MVEMLQKEVDENSTFEMVVRRSHILSDTLRRMEKVTFDPRKKLNVCVYWYIYLYTDSL